MLRQSRIDISGALHHIITRGIERRGIFDDDDDRRCKSILCQEDPYLLELVRYIHLNPLRAGLVNDREHLYKYPFSGHGAIMGVYDHPWQNSDAVLAFFGERTISARRGYRAFVVKGIDYGERADLIGGGLIRSLICFWVVRELGVSMALLARRFNISGVAVSKSVKRGAEIAKGEGYELI